MFSYRSTTLFLKKITTNKNNYKIFTNPFKSSKINRPIEIPKLNENLSKISVRNFHSTPPAFGFMKFGVKTIVGLATQEGALSAKNIQETVIRSGLQEIGFNEQDGIAIIKILNGLSPILPKTVSQTFSNIKFDRTLFDPKKWMETTIDELKKVANTTNFSIDNNLNDEQRKLALEGARHFVKEVVGKSNDDIYKESINQIGIILIEQQLGIRFKKI